MAKSRKPAGPVAEPRIETISIDELVPDPANLRIHGPKNSRAVTGSVRRFGPWRSVAIDQGNVIYAGNETARAAKEAGITEVLKVTPKPGQLVAVCREDMTETEKTAYGIADNQTSLIDDATWAPELPAAISSLELDGFDLDCLGFDDDQLNGLLGSPENVAPPVSDDELAGVTVRSLADRPLPEMAWVLVGVPLDRYATVDRSVRALAAIPGVICETTVSDVNKKDR